MGIWKLWNTQLCLPALEIKEVIQDVKVDFGHPDCVMEEAVG